MSMSECARGQAMASVNTTSDASYLAGNFWMLTDCVISEKSDMAASPTILMSKNKSHVSSFSLTCSSLLV